MLMPKPYFLVHSSEPHSSPSRAVVEEGVLPGIDRDVLEALGLHALGHQLLATALLLDEAGLGIVVVEGEEAVLAQELGQRGRRLLAVGPPARSGPGVPAPTGGGNQRHGDDEY